MANRRTKHPQLLGDELAARESTKQVGSTTAYGTPGVVGVSASPVRFLFAEDGIARRQIRVHQAPGVPYALISRAGNAAPLGRSPRHEIAGARLFDN